MLKRLSVYLSFVRFSHSVFALPFALAGALLAAAQRRIPVLLDGYIVGAAALLAHAIAPQALGY